MPKPSGRRIISAPRHVEPFAPFVFIVCTALDTDHRYCLELRQGGLSRPRWIGGHWAACFTNSSPGHLRFEHPPSHWCGMLCSPAESTCIDTNGAQVFSQIVSNSVPPLHGASPEAAQLANALLERDPVQRLANAECIREQPFFASDYHLRPIQSLPRRL